MRSATLDPKLAAHHDPRSPAAEAYRVLRTNLQFMALDRPLRTLLVTSAAPSEGKSLTSANLAITFAQAGQRVLLVEADLRRPSLNKVFGLSRTWSGLTTVLAAGAQIEDVVVETPVPGLHLLPSGPIPPNPAEVLASARMREFLAQVQQSYDLVILDTPPVLAVTDPCVLAPQVDGVLLVVRAGRVTRPQAQRAKAALEAVQARVLGVVVNDVKAQAGSEGYYYYYYYGEKR